MTEAPPEQPTGLPFFATIKTVGFPRKTYRFCVIARFVQKRDVDSARKRLHPAKTVRFQTKTFQFRVIARFVQKWDVDSARKRLHPAKTVRFQTKTFQFSCHCEERSDVAILKSKVWHPVTKHGSTKQKGSPITKKYGIRRFILLSLSSFQGSVSFRSTIFRYGMANRFV